MSGQHGITWAVEGRKLGVVRHGSDHQLVGQLAVVVSCDVYMQVAPGTVVEPT
jgi:hypothetical protein